MCPGPDCPGLGAALASLLSAGSGSMAHFLRLGGFPPLPLELGRDAFHRVPVLDFEIRDAVKWIPTIYNEEKERKCTPD